MNHGHSFFFHRSILFDMEWDLQYLSHAIHNEEAISFRTKVQLYHEEGSLLFNCSLSLWCASLFYLFWDSQSQQGLRCQICRLILLWFHSLPCNWYGLVYQSTSAHCPWWMVFQHYLKHFIVQLVSRSLLPGLFPLQDFNWRILVWFVWDQAHNQACGTDQWGTSHCMTFLFLHLSCLCSSLRSFQQSITQSILCLSRLQWGQSCHLCHFYIHFFSLVLLETTS